MIVLLLRRWTVSMLLLASGITQAQPTPVAPPPRDVDVPYVVSAPVVTRTMLELAKVDKSDFVIDLGSGDGRIVFLAAQRYGARGLGVEIDPRLVETAIEDTQKLRLTHLVNFRVQNLFETDLSPASVITMYLLPDVNLQLRDKLLQLKPGTRVVSHDWDMGDWQADDMRVIENLEKSLGLEKSSKVFLWVIPARLAGQWCGQLQRTGDAALRRTEPTKPTEPTQSTKPTETTTVRLDIEQQYQQLSGSLTIHNGSKSATRRIPVRTNIVGNRFVVNIGNQDIIVDADGEGLTLFADAPRPRHIAGSAAGTLHGLTALFAPLLPATETVRLKRGAECTSSKANLPK